MKTSNFSRWARAKWPGAIAISRTVPSWYDGPRYPALYPPADLLRAAKAGEVTWEEYASRYRAEVLDKLDLLDVVADLHRMVPNDAEPVVLCHCPRWAPCHRRIVAEWVGAALGGEVQEA